MRRTPQLARCLDRDTQCVRERGKLQSNFGANFLPVACGCGPDVTSPSLSGGRFSRTESP